MTKYDSIMLILNSIPSVMAEYFTMLSSGDQGAITGGLLGLLSITIICYRIIRLLLEATCLRCYL